MTDPDLKIWDGMLAYLRRHSPTLCRQWFAELEPLIVDGGTLFLRAQSPVHRDYLRRLCTEPFNDAARTVSGRLLSVRFLGPDDPAPTQGASQPARPRSLIEPKLSHPTHSITPQPAPNRAEPKPAAAQFIEPSSKRDDALVINPDCSFENFIVGPSNRLAHAAAVAVGNSPGGPNNPFNPLFIHGGVGLGKTHLLQAICIRIKQHKPDANLCYISCESFVQQFIEAVRTGDMDAFRHRFRELDCLIVDDIHFLGDGERTQEEFFHTFNTLHTAKKQIVLSSDEVPEKIPVLQDRLVSRLKWGLVTDIQPPDQETRVAILKNKATIRGFDLPDDAASYIASRINGNIRELEGAIGKLQIQASVDDRPIDLSLAQLALGGPSEVGSNEPSIQVIINAVTDFYRVRLVDLQSERRHRSIAQPRQVCMYLIRQHTKHSLEEIGGYFGNRDHTTVMHAIRTVESRRSVEPDFDVLVRSLEDKLRTP